MTDVPFVNSRRFYLLDGIRGMAALLVVLRHTGKYFGSVDFPESYLAVDVFFILSGVLVCYAYENRLKAGMTFGEFVKARLIFASIPCTFSDPALVSSTSSKTV